MFYLVKFQSLLEDDDIQYGILLDDNRVLCLDCLGTFEEDDYDIIERYEEIPLNISEMIKKELKKNDNK